MEYQSKQADPEMEKKLKKKVQKYKALVMDLQDELDHERDMRSNSAMVKSLRNQLDDLQASESTAVKAQKRLQAEVDDLQVQSDEITRSKMEVGVPARHGQLRQSVLPLAPGVEVCLLNVCVCTD